MGREDRLISPAKKPSEEEDDPELISRWERAMSQRYAPLEKDEKVFIFCPQCKEQIRADISLVNAHFIGKHFDLWEKAFFGVL